MIRTKIFPVALFLLFIRAGLYAQTIPADDFADSGEIREKILKSHLTQEIDSLRYLKNAEYSDRYGTVFSVSQGKDSDAGLLAITVEPVLRSGFQGKWILFRRLSDGMPDRIQIFPTADPSLFITLRPDGENPEKGKTLLGMSVYGSWACRDIPLGFSFLSMYSAPLSSIFNMSAKLVPWYLFAPDIVRYSVTESAAYVVRSGLDTLVYLDDGAFNEKGEPVMILGGVPQEKQALLSALAPGQNSANISGGVNCSGFAKWIVDGIIRISAGQGLYINPLKTQTSSPETLFTDPYRESRDLFFALDWTRNLASAVVSASAKKTMKPDVSGVDVTTEPFAGSAVYEKNVGYKTEDSKALLYYLAVNEPGHFYLGAISRERGTPLLRQYHHVAAFFPYFDHNGRFQVAVFESAVETPVDNFIKNNIGAYLHLVRIRLPEEGYFQP